MRAAVNRPTHLKLILCASPLFALTFARWPEIGLPDCWLVAGAVAQTVWNDAFALPFSHGISDIDLIYFDPHDLSQDKEAGHSARIRNILSDLPIRIDVKNEARVHLWYEEKFFYPIQPYASVTGAIASFPTTATAIGIRPERDRFLICAPYGLSDLFGLIVRPNKKQITRAAYDAKIARWRTLWPALSILPWE